MQLRAIFTLNPLHIMSGGQTIRAQLPRGGQQIGEFNRLITAHTGDRGFTAQIAIGEILHHLVVEAIFIIQHIMRNTQPRRNGARIMDINTGTTGAFGLDRDSMIIKLQGDANHLIPLFMQQSGRD